MIGSSIVNFRKMIEDDKLIIFGRSRPAHGCRLLILRGFGARDRLLRRRLCAIARERCRMLDSARFTVALYRQVDNDYSVSGHASCSSSQGLGWMPPFQAARRFGTAPCDGADALLLPEGRALRLFVFFNRVVFFGVSIYPGAERRVDGA